MKRLMLVTLAVLAASLAVGILGARTLDGAVDEALTLSGEIALRAQEGGAQEAAEALEALSQMWRRRAGALEMLTSHDALGEVAAAIAEARICLRRGAVDEALRVLAVMDERLERIRGAEAFRLSNLY